MNFSYSTNQYICESRLSFSHSISSICSENEMADRNSSCVHMQRALFKSTDNVSWVGIPYKDIEAKDIGVQKDKALSEMKKCTDCSFKSCSEYVLRAHMKICHKQKAQTKAEPVSITKDNRSGPEKEITYQNDKSTSSQECALCFKCYDCNLEYETHQAFENHLKSKHIYRKVNIITSSIL